MNQRTGNSSRHAAMFSRQLVKRRDGVGVAQNNGHLPSFLAQGGLTLGTGLGLGHSGGQLAHEVHALAMRLPAGEMSRHELAPVLAGGRDSEQALFGGNPNQFARLGADGFGKGAALSENGKHRHFSLEKPEFTASHVGHDDHALGPDGKDCVLQDAGIAGVHGGGNRGGVVVVHGLLRSGPIPPMGESSHVTSDVSTPSRKYFLEVA